MEALWLAVQKDSVIQRRRQSAIQIRRCMRGDSKEQDDKTKKKKILMLGSATQIPFNTLKSLRISGRAAYLVTCNYCI
ncbi:hypothetical protein Q3G72_012893 [Acer saccharum]|nr:hypothetical protein Q3G72_012893 [Acer saccharum]